MEYNADFDSLDNLETFIYIEVVTNKMNSDFLTYQ